MPFNKSKILNFKSSILNIIHSLRKDNYYISKEEINHFLSSIPAEKYVVDDKRKGCYVFNKKYLDAELSKKFGIHLTCEDLGIIDFDTLIEKYTIEEKRWLATLVHFDYNKFKNEFCQHTSSVRKGNETARILIDDMSMAFREIEELDSKNIHFTNDMVAFYQTSLNLLNYVKDNFKRDPDLTCLKILIDILIFNLWKQAYIGGDKIDLGIVDNVQTFFDDERQTLDKYIDQSAILKNLLRRIKIAEKDNSDIELDSLKYRYDSTKKIVIALQSELNAKQESLLASYQNDLISSDKIIAEFKYSDRVAKENETKFQKIDEAAKTHYEYVRSKTTQFIIDLESQEKDNEGTIDTLDEVLGSERVTSVKNNITDSIKELINHNNPDLVGAYAKIRFAIDSYLKYKEGIDLNLSASFNGFKTGKKYRSSKDIFLKIFGFKTGNYIDNMWDESSEILHAGNVFLDLDTDPKGLMSLKSKLIGYADFLDGVIDLNNIDYVSGVKKLYLDRKKWLEDFASVNQGNPGFAGFSVDKDRDLKEYKRYLMAKGVADDFFENIGKETAYD